MFQDYVLRLDSKNAEPAKEMFENLGLNLDIAVNIFLSKCLYEDGLPFEVKYTQPNKETMQAMLEAEELARDPNAKSFRTAEEVLEDIFGEKVV